MNEAIRIKCLIRNNFNKRELNVLRKNNFLSSSLSSSLENFHFYLFSDDFINKFKSRNSLFSLIFCNDIEYFNNNLHLSFIKEKLSYVKNIHKDFLDNKIIHIDFNGISSVNDFITIRVPLKITSVVKDFTLNVNVFQVFHSVLIKCRAYEAPEFINYELTSGYKKKSISIKDLIVKNETILENKDTVFALIKNSK